VLRWPKVILLFFVSTELGKFQQAFPEFSKVAVEEVISIFKLYVHVISFLGNLPRIVRFDAESPGVSANWI
jgi:hypothetical protein